MRISDWSSDVCSSDLPSDRPVLPGACDAHVQVFGDPQRFPCRDGADQPIGPAGAEEYVALRRRLGLDRAVLVQPGVYGFDHACLVDALGQLDAGADGKGGHARGVAAVAPSVSEAALRERDAAGWRAAHFPMREETKEAGW